MKLYIQSFIVLILVSLPVFAADTSDKTGTNPINFTNDFRLYNEYLWLDTEGDGNINITTAEYRTPFLGGKWQFRTRIRFVETKADLNDDGDDDLDTNGLGEIDFRVLTVPIVKMEDKFALAVGLETFLPTGNSVVGSERLSFGPQIFGVFFNPFGIKGSLIAPAYQHRFSVYEEDDVRSLNQSALDLFFLKQSDDKQKWVLVNPQYIVDHNLHTQGGAVEAEMGVMLNHLGFNLDGRSVYVRPSIGIGPDRLTDGSIELGWKQIW
ncbi:MAG: hypothetical protein R8G33_05110 [Gammaproteobacteria bacterium]|nr:hypothetical protein [Gammaproteobacteria bacterium]